MVSNVVATALTGSDQTIHAAPAGVNSVPTLYGWSIRESAGTPAVATVLIRSGSLSGPIVAAIELVADGSSTEWFGPQGVQARGGLYVDVVAGAVEGSVYHA